MSRCRIEEVNLSSVFLQKFRAVALEQSTSEFLSVKHHFHQTVAKTEAEITNIRRIQNPDLWKSYVVYVLLHLNILKLFVIR